MDAVTGRIERLRDSGVLGQLVRFGIVGLLSTGIYSAVYLPLVYWVLPAGRAFLAVPPAFLVAAAFGFFAHGRWSFQGHGSRDAGAVQPVKFMVVQGFGMVLNALFTLVLADWMGLAEWVPLVPAMLVTPFATFALNRTWVFG
ncbi:GtrA family protein [Sphingomonas sp. VNH70]|uniref:GtrA family protein n=1 Tax=Sphingomonas silueang TaxID=3156617 RepID=UPI0032B5715F